MMAKIVKSSSFNNTVNYILDNKKDATLIANSGVRNLNNQSIIDSFSLQAQLNPNVSKCVGHIVLSFSEEDKNKISDELMVKVANEYMQKMGIIDTQYIIGRHFDKSHPHIHLCYNRINNNGRTISDKNDRIRSSHICKELTLKYGLHYADSNRRRVKMHRLREPDKTRHHIFRTIEECLFLSKNWDEFLVYMQSAGIDVKFKKNKNTNEIQGISFSKNSYSFSGSKIAKKYSYSKLDAVLSRNNNLNIDKSREINISPTQNHKTIKVDLSILDALPNNIYDTSNEEVYNRRKRKVKR